jgi:hypothetical protein
MTDHDDSPGTLRVTYDGHHLPTQADWATVEKILA